MKTSLSRRLLSALAAVCLLAPVAPAVAAAAPQGAIDTAVVAQAGTSAATVTRTEWLTDRRVALFIDSPAMGKEVQVQLLLGRDWHANPRATFPVMYFLDGLRAHEGESGWTQFTNIEQFFADKNVTAVLPVGGESSFYADWQQEDNGTHYMWETFLTEELPPIINADWRTTGTNGIAGLSMGGTAAVNLAARNPELYTFVASYSGYLDTTSFGMPLAINHAMQDAGGYTAQRMWGAYGSADWLAHDPKLLVDKLVGKTVYVSAGNGNAGQFDDPNNSAGVPGNLAGSGLEILSRMTSQTFVQRARAAGVDVTTAFRPSGTHSWPYWQFEMAQSWPTMARALGTTAEREGCIIKGAIAVKVTEFSHFGACTTEEYEVGSGVAQEFRGGRMFWSPETGAQGVWGAILARYLEVGGPTGELGFPTTSEYITPDGRGRYVHFQNGSIYWTPETGAQLISGGFKGFWGGIGWETGVLGYPTTAEYAAGNGVMQDFEGGYLTGTSEHGVVETHGQIARLYRELGGGASWLGLATNNEIRLTAGAFSPFAEGNIYWSPATGPQAIPYGPIFDAWGAAGYENGEFGYPTSGLKKLDSGESYVEFEHGTIRLLNGQITEERH